MKIKNIALGSIVFLILSCDNDIDWNTYLGNQSRSHFSELKQIHAGNINSLELAWEYESGQIDAAIRHLKISTAAGYKLSLESMEELRDEGHISEEEYNRAVADVVAAQKEEHTEERAAARKQRDINPALQ